MSNSDFVSHMSPDEIRDVIHRAGRVGEPKSEVLLELLKRMGICLGLSIIVIAIFILLAFYQNEDWQQPLRSWGILILLGAITAPLITSMQMNDFDPMESERSFGTGAELYGEVQDYLDLILDDKNNKEKRR